MKRFFILCATIICGFVLLAGCGKEQQVAVDARDLDPFSEEAFCAWHIGSPETGQEIFERLVLADRAGCVTCHSRSPETTLVGPSLYGVAATAAKRMEGVIPANYLYLSIVEPSFYVVEGFAADVMPSHYADALSEEEITNLVSYLMTLYPDD